MYLFVFLPIPTQKNLWATEMSEIFELNLYLGIYCLIINVFYCNAVVCMFVYLCVCVSAALYHTIAMLNVINITENVKKNRL